MHVEIERDGVRFRWVLMLGDRRIAKGFYWWASDDEALTDYEAFAAAVASDPQILVQGKPHADPAEGK